MKEREGGRRRRRCRRPAATVGGCLMRLVREDSAKTCPRQAEVQGRGRSLGGKGGGKPQPCQGRASSSRRRDFRREELVRLDIGVHLQVSEEMSSARQSLGRLNDTLSFIPTVMTTSLATAPGTEATGAPAARMAQIEQVNSTPTNDDDENHLIFRNRHTTSGASVRGMCG